MSSDHIDASDADMSYNERMHSATVIDLARQVSYPHVVPAQIHPRRFVLLYLPRRVSIITSPVYMSIQKIRYSAFRHDMLEKNGATKSLRTRRRCCLANIVERHHDTIFQQRNDRSCCAHLHPSAHLSPHRFEKSFPPIAASSSSHRRYRCATLPLQYHAHQVISDASHRFRDAGAAEERHRLALPATARKAHLRRCT